MRRVGVAVVTLIALTASLFVAEVGQPEPASARHDEPLWHSHRWELRAKPLIFERAGRRYELLLEVVDTRASEEIVNVTLTSRRDPPGLAEAVQTHDYSYTVTFDKNENRFTHRRTLSSAAFDDDAAMGDGATVRLKFTATQPLESRCDGHVSRRVGRLSGALRFDTGEGDIGVVTELPRRAVLVHHDGMCPYNPYRECPENSLEMRAYRDGADDMSVAARRRDGAPTATIRVGHSSQTYGRGEWHEIVATVPGENVEIASDLSRATIKGAPGTYITGTAVARALTSPEEPPLSPSSCGEDVRWFVETQRFTDTVSGDLVGRFWIGGDRHLDSSPLQGLGVRYVMADES